MHLLPPQLWTFLILRSRDAVSSCETRVGCYAYTTELSQIVSELTCRKHNQVRCLLVTVTHDSFCYYSSTQSWSLGLSLPICTTRKLSSLPGPGPQGIPAGQPRSFTGCMHALPVPAHAHWGPAQERASPSKPGLELCDCLQLSLRI